MSTERIQGDYWIHRYMAIISWQSINRMVFELNV